MKVVGFGIFRWKTSVIWIRFCIWVVFASLRAETVYLATITTIATRCLETKITTAAIRYLGITRTTTAETLYLGITTIATIAILYLETTITTILDFLSTIITTQTDPATNVPITSEFHCQIFPLFESFSLKLLLQILPLYLQTPSRNCKSSTMHTTLKTRTSSST